MESLIKILLTILLLASLTTQAEDEGLVTTEKSAIFHRFKLNGTQFLKNKKLTFLSEDHRKVKTCYQIDIDKNLRFKLSGNDLYTEGRVELTKDNFTLVPSMTKAYGVVMPKGGNIVFKFEKDYDLWRFPNSSPLYKKKSYMFNIVPSSSSKYDFIFTECKLFDVCYEACPLN